MNTCIVHDWIATYAGSEKVVQSIYNTFPQSHLATLFAKPGPLNQMHMSNLPLQTTFLQKLPLASRSHRYLLPLMPFAVEQLDLTPYDLIISSAHAVAKGIITSPDQLHICYMHTPTRYAWDLQNQYLSSKSLKTKLLNPLMRLALHRFRIWDQLAGQRPDLIIANSHYIARRIQKIYKRAAHVIYPPVDVDRFKPQTNRDSFFLTVTRAVPYKRLDLIVRAFNQTNHTLKIVGSGPQLSYLKKIAKPNIQFLEHQPDKTVTELMQTCRAFVFTALEDFGISPVEAMAAGAPVIALGQAGTAETVIHQSTGLLFPEQTPQHLLAAINQFTDTSTNFDPNYIANHAQQFSIQRFESQIKTYIQEQYHLFQERKNEHLQAQPHLLSAASQN
ncbi:GDP-mannose-dependent alpha-(1-6)-phosphatidylinositol monomannoside mannosyltransferase [Poriferisphaera corsica]|uniref:GDP-mannose-dependent alpha-(1-6)-phosphatidylinositol monomannoside mannosyltransferase n=1 Tax=Poriferisphaera corsica TaxID=2528020 RepID=A0A517YP92_9BACT|nr:glycosyltransferase [Poriferisphaera corsica]QDU32041.1 GDP-mannose-dependent alpha-(1-6)-phosphatidylinositol monomannoside mannosyltransferase [Poriferisphaera corsica]